MNIGVKVEKLGDACRRMLLLLGHLSELFDFFLDFRPLPVRLTPLDLHSHRVHLGYTVTVLSPLVAVTNVRNRF